MFSSVTTACRGRTRFRWNSGETFQQETHRRHQKPKAMLISSSRVTFARVARVGNISFNFCDAVPEQDLTRTLGSIIVLYCLLSRIQFTLHCLFVQQNLCFTLVVTRQATVSTLSRSLSLRNLKLRFIIRRKFVFLKLWAKENLQFSNFVVWGKIF